ncbi:MAG: hypothetical protein V1861_06250 [Candidatus Micrarchaeota archaeon]
MESNSPISAQRYRSLVLSHLYILARETNIPMRSLPQQTLARLGVTRSVDAASVTTFCVEIPADLESKGVKEMLGRFERQVAKNRCLFSKTWTADVKKVRFRPRNGAKLAGREGWDIEPLDEKALIRMASAL